jgi:hypothetical protein
MTLGYPFVCDIFGILIFLNAFGVIIALILWPIKITTDKSTVDFGVCHYLKQWGVRPRGSIVELQLYFERDKAMVFLKRS